MRPGLRCAGCVADAGTGGRQHGRSGALPAQAATRGQILGAVLQQRLVQVDVRARKVIPVAVQHVLLAGPVPALQGYGCRVRNMHERQGE